MKSEEKEFDIKEMSISLDVDSSVIDRVCHSDRYIDIFKQSNKNGQGIIPCPFIVYYTLIRPSYSQYNCWINIEFLADFSSNL